MKASQRSFPTRRLGSGIFVVLGALFGAVACGGNEPAPKSPIPGDSEVEASPSPYAVFPEDSELLVGASLAGIRATALWEQYGDVVLSSLDAGGVLADARQACGFDPLEEAEGVRYGGTTAKPHEMVLVVEGMSKAQVRACFDGAAKMRGDELAVTGEGPVVKYALKDYELLLGWVDEETFLVRPEGAPDEAWLEQRVSGTAGLQADSPLAQLTAGRADGAAGFWLGAMPGQGTPMRNNLAASGAPVPQSIAASVTAAEGLELDLEVRFDAAEVAAQVRDQVLQMAEMAKLQLGELGKIVDQLELTVEGERLSVALALTVDDLAAISAQLGPVLGGPGAQDTPEVAAPAEPAPGVRPPTADDLATYTEDLKGSGPLMATLKTSEGSIPCRLFEKKVPMTVANFVGLARGLKRWQHPVTGEAKEEPLYDGTIFHRVIPDFMIQGGDPVGDGRGGPGYEFDNEIVDGIGHSTPGTLAMANSGPDTNGSQFFITDSAQARLDGSYTVFGRCQGLDVIKKIARVETSGADKPVDDVVLESVTITRGGR